MSTRTGDAAGVDVARRSSLARATTRLGPYLLLAPSALFMLLLFGWPLVVGVAQAFGGFATPTTANWQRMSADPRFWLAFRNTLLLVIVLIPLQFALALSMALLLREKLRFSGVYFYLWAVPLAVSDLAAGLVWLSIFTNNGYLNSVLGWFGIDPVEWLSYQSPSTMFLAVVGFLGWDDGVLKAAQIRTGLFSTRPSWLSLRHFSISSRCSKHLMSRERVDLWRCLSSRSYFSRNLPKATAYFLPLSLPPAMRMAYWRPTA